VKVFCEETRLRIFCSYEDILDTAVLAFLSACETAMGDENLQVYLPGINLPPPPRGCRKHVVSQPVWLLLPFPGPLSMLMVPKLLIRTTKTFSNTFLLQRTLLDSPLSKLHKHFMLVSQSCAPKMFHFCTLGSIHSFREVRRRFCRGFQEMYLFGL
jgi:hypothetical protein